MLLPWWSKGRREKREEEGKGMKVNSFLVCEQICFDFHHIKSHLLLGLLELEILQLRFPQLLHYH